MHAVRRGGKSRRREHQQLVTSSRIRLAADRRTLFRRLFVTLGLNSRNEKSREAAFWANVCKTVALCYQTVVCLSVCLSVLTCPVLSVLSICL